jgi:hypothetical protein
MPARARKDSVKIMLHVQSFRTWIEFMWSRQCPLVGLREHGRLNDLSDLIKAGDFLTSHVGVIIAASRSYLLLLLLLLLVWFGEETPRTAAT